MAQELARQRFCTVTHFVQLNVDSVLVLHVHALPANEDGSFGSSTAEPANTLGLPPPFSWLAERHMQELLVMVHEVVNKRALEGLTVRPPPAGSKKSKTVLGPDLQLKRGMSVRALFHFKEHTVHQHIVLPTNPSLPNFLSSPDTFVNGHGRLVFESSGISTAGGGYQPFRSLQESLHVFVDQYEPTSSMGVIKVMMLLDPSRKQSLDVLSYFQPAVERENCEGREGEREEETECTVLDDLPVEGLKKRRRNGGGRGGKEVGRGRNTGRKGRESGGKNRRKKSTEKQANSTNDKSRKNGSRSMNKRGSPKDQPLQAIDTDQSKLTSHFSPLTKLTEKMSVSEIDRLFGMDSDWLSDNDDESEMKQNEEKKAKVTKEEDRRVEESSVSKEKEEDGVVTEDLAYQSLSPLNSDRNRETLSTNEGSPKIKDSESGSSNVTTPCSPAACSGDLSSELFYSFSTPPLSVSDNEEMELQDREIEFEDKEMEIGEAVGGDVKIQRDSNREQMSPDLLSPEMDSPSSPFSANPLDDITNCVPGSSTSNSQKETSFQQQDQPPVLDLVDGEGGVIIIGSEEDEIECSGESMSQQYKEGIDCQEKRKKNKKRKILSPETLFCGARELKDVPKKKVSRWLGQQKEVLIGLYQGKVYSRRHQTFISGAKGRAALLHQMSNRQFTEEQRDAITSGLMNAFCHKSMNLFSYVMSVLYPECLIRLLMDFHSISFEQAERKMMGYDTDLSSEVVSD